MVPDPHPLPGLLAQEIASRCHRDAFDHFQTGFSCAARSDCAAGGTALVVFPEQKLPGRNLGWIEGNERAQYERRGRARSGFFFLAVSILLCSTVVSVA